MDNVFFREYGYKKQIFIVLGLIFVFIAFALFFLNKKNEYLIINESSLIVKKGSKYYQIKKFDDSILNKKYNVYSDNKLYKNLLIKRNSSNWYYFNDDYKDMQLNLVSLAFTDKFGDLKSADYNASYYEDDDEVILNEVFGDKNNDDFKNSLIKSSFDLDGDGIAESIYTVNENNLGNSFSSIFLVRNDKLVKIIDEDDKSAFLVQSIVDLDGDGKYEIIVSKGSADVVTFDTCIQIYSINKDKIKKIMDCK